MPQTNEEMNFALKKIKKSPVVGKKSSHVSAHSRCELTRARTWEFSNYLTPNIPRHVWIIFFLLRSFLKLDNGISRRKNAPHLLRAPNNPSSVSRLKQLEFILMAERVGNLNVQQCSSEIGAYCRIKLNYNKHPLWYPKPARSWIQHRRAGKYLLNKSNFN